MSVVPYASADQILIAVGTNNRSLKLLVLSYFSGIPSMRGGSASPGHRVAERSVELLQEWPEAHKGSVYCTDVLGSLGSLTPNPSGAISRGGVGATPVGGCLIASGSNDKCVRIYRPDTGEISPPMKGHSGC